MKDKEIWKLLENDETNYDDEDAPRKKKERRKKDKQRTISRKQERKRKEITDESPSAFDEWD